MDSGQRGSRSERPLRDQQQFHANTVGNLLGLLSLQVLCENYQYQNEDFGDN